jgi:hypothetical protein
MKITLKNLSIHYSEIPQPNPLRWYIVVPKGAATYENVSGELKCKDFFNDLAYTIQTGKDFSIYGFNAGTYSPPKKDKPVYLAVKHTTAYFEGNMKVLNKWLEKDQGFPAVGVEKSQEGIYLLTIPPIYWTNTYYTSLITLVIRLMNQEEAFSSFDEVIKKTTFAVQDQNLWKQVVAKKWFFKNLPTKLSKYVYYCGEAYNSEKQVDAYSISQLVHNNGVIGWMNAS